MVDKPKLTKVAPLDFKKISSFTVAAPTGQFSLQIVAFMTTMTAVRSAVRYVSQVKYSCARLVVFGKILLKNVTRSRYRYPKSESADWHYGHAFRPARSDNLVGTRGIRGHETELNAGERQMSWLWPRTETTCKVQASCR